MLEAMDFVGDRSVWTVDMSSLDFEVRILDLRVRLLTRFPQLPVPPGSSGRTCSLREVHEILRTSLVIASVKASENQRAEFHYGRSSPHG